MHLISRLATLTSILLIAATGCAHQSKGAHKTPAGQEAFEKDRKAILAMAGEYEVTFDFHETLRFDPTAPVSEPDNTTGHEAVLVLEDKGSYISLQHLLVVGDKQVVKHWRQDWRYEDSTIHEFKGHLTWQPRMLSKNEARGTWTQSVYQVDDSPRYEGVGRWFHRGDYSYWDSNETWRPLPRREYTKRDDYDVVVGRNRHSITKDGWIHEQDNYKLRLRDGKEQVIARESGCNTYQRVSDFDFTAAYDYWKKTEPFWADVRKVWTAEYDAKQPFYLIGDDNKDSLWRLVMNEADQYAKSGKLPDGGIAKTIHERLHDGLPKSN